MGRSLSPLLRRELANLDKDASSRRSAIKALKSYVRELDSKAIPHFLAGVSETKDPGSSPGECTISLYEVLARVHGSKIVPQIDNIMSTIMRTLSSSAGSFPLHQACSRVVPAIVRYGIDPSTSADEKMRIIRSLYKPLSDALMGSPESVASGAALCLTALVEADNWRFAEDNMVNEVCLRVAGALEEKATQTNYHMALVMALSKHNSLIAEAYARSFLRSGLQILNAGVTESNTQKRLSAMQMINSLMKCVDSRSISSELANVVDSMEKCRADQFQFVRVAAWETLQTAKTIAAQKGSKEGTFSTPGMELDSLRGATDNEGSGENCYTAEFPSPESQTIDSFVGYDAFTDSPISIRQSSFNLEDSRRTNRRLWANGYGGVDVSLKDGLFLSGCDVSEVEFERSDTHMGHKEVFSGFVHSRAESEGRRSTTPSPQRTRTQLTLDDIKIYSTPRRLIRSLQDPSDANSEASVFHSPNSSEVEQQGSSHPHDVNSVVKQRWCTERISFQGPEAILDSTESVSSTADDPKDIAFKMLSGNCEDMNEVTRVRRIKYSKATLGFGLALVFLAIILSVMSTGEVEIYIGVVPT